jgi:hypothetical protein
MQPLDSQIYWRIAGTTGTCTCYCMCMALDHRLQILLDDERHQRLVGLAAERGVSVATIVREAIDRGLTAGDGRRRAAAQRLLGAPDMPVPEPQELRDELDELRGRRA